MQLAYVLCLMSVIVSVLVLCLMSVIVSYVLCPVPCVPCVPWLGSCVLGIGYWLFEDGYCAGGEGADPAPNL